MQDQDQNDKAVHSRANYIWGIFYFNREDDRVLVPKRRGWGCTFNFARAEAWLIIGIVLLTPAIVLPVVILSAR